VQAAVADHKHLERLNSAQREAAAWGKKLDGQFVSGPLLIIAGAGTGKTMTLAHRVAHLLIHNVAPQRILLLTFTRRAAQEMTRRVDSIVRNALGPGKSVMAGAGVLPWSGTFHAVANRLLRRFAANLELDPGFSVLDRGDAADLMDVARHELSLSRTHRRFPKKATCLAIFSRCANASIPLGDVLQDSYPWCADWEEELRQLFRHYVDRKQQCQALDYDDLLLYWKHLVADAEFAAQIGSWFDHVLVDEYQDTNTVQAEILRSIKPAGNGVTVVGDDAQSIYSFRAAEVENILGFPDQYTPAAEVISLQRNYRSAQPILDTANHLIAESDRQYRKKLYSVDKPGAMPRYVTVEDSDAEVDFVVDAVLHNRESGMRLMEQAVLFRGSHHSDRLELELLRRNIPYVKYGGLKFLEAGHVKDMLSVLKWAENAKNEVAAFRVLKLLAGMGPAYASKCFAYLRNGSFAFSQLREFRPPAGTRSSWKEFCDLMCELSADTADGDGWQTQLAGVRRWYQPHLERLYDGLDTRVADLEQLEQVAARYPTRERFLTELTLDPPEAAGDLAGDPLLDEDYLVLSTVHSAKGQEWAAVFVLNVSDGVFPSEFAAGKAEMIEEERRLLYVAMTRAKQELSLIAPLKFYVTQQRKDGGKHVFGARSRFMTDPLLATMQRQFFGRNEPNATRQLPASDRRIDVAGRMREMW
jgi:DNA helicase-2/ATP-dependent DNA helicase PcrA